jgi:hypothetical protein
MVAVADMAYKHFQEIAGVRGLLESERFEKSKRWEIKYEMFD